ncbi:MAG: hypothetical protein V2A34_02305 [Lentisphaerota bacterium]
MNHGWRSFFRLGAFLVIPLCMATHAHGQWISETFNLSNGWNAVYLRSTPWPVDLDGEFTNLPIRAVHRSYLSYDVAQFSASAGDTPVRETEWLIWYPPDSPHRILTTLWNMSGNASYFIECYSNCVWTFKGNPVIPARVWLPNNWNFTGVPVNPGREVPFTDFFRGARNIDVSPSLAGGKVFRTLPNGSHQDISSQTAMMPIHPGEAYWIKTQGLSAYIGTIMAKGTLGGMFFPPGISINAFTIWNDLGAGQQVTVRLLASQNPPSGAPPRVGDVPLQYFGENPGTGQFEWRTFDLSTTIQKTLASNEQWEITFAVNRGAMTPPGDTNATWQSVIEVSDEGGTLIWIPVEAEYGEPDPYNALWPSGLWVGDATFYGVAQISGEETSEPMPVYGPLTMRLLLHVGTNGQCRLLQQAVLEWRETASQGVTNRYCRLYANARGLPANADATRVSSVAFPLNMNLLMSGTLRDGLTGTYTVGYDNATHPFKHVYNPNHDNRDADGALLADGMENSTFSNTVSLTVNLPEAMDTSATLWNPEEQITGRYAQALYGLRREPVQAEGTFTLRRVSKTGIVE